MARGVWLLVVVLVACDRERQDPPPARSPAGAISVSFERYHVGPSRGRLWLVTIDPTRAALDLAAAPEPKPLAEVVGEAGDFVAVNGGFYADDRPMGLVVRGGKRIAPLTRNGGSGVFALVGEKARIVHRDAGAALSPTLALQSIDRLVDAGKVLVRPRADLPRDARSAVAIRASGDVVFVVAFDDEAIASERDGVVRLDSDSSTTGVTLLEFAELLVERGAETALNLDGGYSTSMRIRLGETEREVVAHRATINALVARPRPD